MQARNLMEAFEFFKFLVALSEIAEKAEITETTRAMAREEAIKMVDEAEEAEPVESVEPKSSEPLGHRRKDVAERMAKRAAELDTEARTMESAIASYRSPVWKSDIGIDWRYPEKVRDRNQAVAQSLEEAQCHLYAAAECFREAAERLTK